MYSFKSRISQLILHIRMDADHLFSSKLIIHSHRS
jgi:hypothetical protein